MLDGDRWNFECVLNGVYSRGMFLAQCGFGAVCEWVG